jgi:RNA polymerase sigma-70 factor (ECF subfamily)
MPPSVLSAETNDLVVEQAAARANADCFGELVGFLRRLTGDGSAAEDIAQEAGVRLIALARRERVDDPRAFLFHVAANLARNHLRHRLVAAGYVDTHEPQEPAAGADHVAQAREELAAVAKVIERMPPRPRDVLLLARVEGLTNKEIAARLGLAPKTVENHLTRALTQLWSSLRGKGRQCALGGNRAMACPWRMGPRA